jgi:hypothetical protein
LSIIPKVRILFFPEAILAALQFPKTSVAASAMNVAVEFFLERSLAVKVVKSAEQVEETHGGLLEEARS